MDNPYDTAPWLRFYADGVPRDITVPDEPLTHLLDDAAARFPRRTAVVFLGRAITYRHLLDLANRAAAALAEIGVRRGDRVALILPNCPQQVIAFYAVLRLGGVVVQCNPLYTAPELAYQLADSGTSTAIVLDRAYAALAEARPSTRVRQVVVTSLLPWLPRGKRLALRLPGERTAGLRAELAHPVPGDADVLDFEELLSRSSDPVAPPPIDPAHDLALLQYTGGTTGRPKGAMLTHANLMANAVQTASWDSESRAGHEITLAVLPMFHVFGLTLCLTTSVLTASTIVLLPKFDTDLVLDAIRKWRPTIFPGVPPLYDKIIAEARDQKVDLSSIRVCVSGAMPLPRGTVEEFRRATGGHLVQGYGMTETSPVTLSNPLNGNARHVSVGLPLPGTRVRVVGEDDPFRMVGVGEAGELLIYGPQVFQGYWNQPLETAEVLNNGWLRTGDIGVMSPDGFFTLLDRKRDVIIVDGFNVFPTEVERVINTHPAVDDSAVVGLPDGHGAEIVKAYVVPLPGAEVSSHEIIAHCAARLVGYKIPELVETRSDLPRNLLGKVLRRLLRDEATWP
ncbi:MAG TPA: AMP-binding protein [Streptosporangiaceae bacterium]